MKTSIFPRLPRGLTEKELRKEFTTPLTNMSVYQGKVLMKLINRETGNNCYEIIKEYKPDVVAVERVFSRLNVKTAMATGQAAGVALLLAAKVGIPVVMHTPSEVKAAVTGSGRADKKQVAQMVKRLLKLKEIPKPVDATDALALAICHHWRGVGNARLAKAKKKASKKR